MGLQYGPAKAARKACRRLAERLSRLCGGNSQLFHSCRKLCKTSPHLIDRRQIPWLRFIFREAYLAVLRLCFCQTVCPLFFYTSPPSISGQPACPTCHCPSPSYPPTPSPNAHTQLLAQRLFFTSPPHALTSAPLRRRSGLLARNPEAVGGLAGLNWAAGIQHLYRTRRKKERPFGERVPPSTVAMLASQFDHYWPHAEMAYVACLLDLGQYSSILTHLTRL